MLPARVGASASAAFQPNSIREAGALNVKKRRTMKQRWGCRESEQARFSFDCLFYLTLSLNTRSFSSAAEGCQAGEVTLQRKELARTV